MDNSIILTALHWQPMRKCLCVINITTAFKCSIQMAVFCVLGGSCGNVNGQFQYPRCISVFNGEVFVTDRDNHRIQVFSLDGQFLRTWGSQGSDVGQFKSPWGIAVSAGGEVFVCDDGNHRIQMFSVEGMFLHTYGSSGKGDGQFCNPSGVVVSAGGEVFVCDYGRSCVQVFG